MASSTLRQELVVPWQAILACQAKKGPVNCFQHILVPLDRQLYNYFQDLL